MAKLGPTRMNIPAIAVTIPTRKTRVTRWRHSTHPASVTKMGARLASSVELATEVYMIDQCHTPRSQAKKTPAPASEAADTRTGAGSARSAHSHSRGAASAVRQKALATGPASERRTKIGAKAMAQPPASRPRKASVSTRGGDGAAGAFTAPFSHGGGGPPRVKWRFPADRKTWTTSSSRR